MGFNIAERFVLAGQSYPTVPHVCAHPPNYLDKDVDKITKRSPLVWFFSTQGVGVGPHVNSACGVTPRVKPNGRTQIRFYTKPRRVHRRLHNGETVDAVRRV
jgi:hypothetical protein